MLGLVCAAVRPLRRLNMGQRHVTHAKRVVLTERCEGAADLPSAFQPEHGGHAPCLVDAHDIAGSLGQLEVSRMCSDQTVDDVDLLQPPADRLVTGNLPVDPHAPELPANATLTEPSYVGHQGLRLTLVGTAAQAFDAPAVILRQLLRQVVVPIDQRGCSQDGVNARLDLAIDGLSHHGRRESKDGGDRERAAEPHGQI